jgi:DNA-binding SARP family transcriptional activator
VDAIRRGDTGSAAKALATKRRKGAEVPAPLKLAEAYLALAGGNLDAARPSVAALAAAHPTWRAAVETEADIAAAEGRSTDALERYRPLLRLAPSDRRARARADLLRTEVATAKKAEAEEALRTGDLDAARRAAHSLLQLEPSSVAGLVLLSRAAAVGGKAEDAWTWANEARKRAPSDRNVAAFAAGAAATAGRWSDAAGLYEGLAATDPSFRPKEEEARLEFKIQNLPESARQAAGSPRLTRAQLASLLWWTLPEVRDALVPPGAEIAVDVVDRRDRAALVKAIGLGFLIVSSETHRVGAESAVSRGDLAAVLRKVALLAGRGRPPRGCLAPDPPSISALFECGILSETTSRSVTGREALRALEKAARLGREGGTR